LSNYTDIQSLNTRDEIKEYVNEVIKELTDFREKKRLHYINKIDLDNIQKDDNNNNL
jgi:ribulose bisphosphate carboxylase small subunit